MRFWTPHKKSVGEELGKSCARKVEMPNLGDLEVALYPKKRVRTTGQIEKKMTKNARER